MPDLTFAERFATAFRPLIPRAFRPAIPVVPVVRLSGVIGLSSPLRSGITLAGCAKLLDRAFAVPDAAAVAIVINSPGGSAVQSHLVHRRIRTLAAEKGLDVIVFVEDVAASGGYMIACAGDHIVADPSSIVGSIGVVGATFGFDRLLEKIGVDRRIYTAGERKVQLDPFLPENADDVKRLKALQKDIHQTFIALVKERRGERLSGSEKTLFSGEYWTGRKALDYGLVDSLGDLRTVLRERYGEKVQTPLVSGERGLFARRVPGVGSALPVAGLAEDLVAAVEARAMWGRYGL